MCNSPKKFATFSNGCCGDLIAVIRAPFLSNDNIAVGGGLPIWIDGIADTGCISTKGSTVAIGDQKGNVYVSDDTAHSWSRHADGLPSPSSVLVV